MDRHILEDSVFVDHDRMQLHFNDTKTSTLTRLAATGGWFVEIDCCHFVCGVPGTG